MQKKIEFKRFATLITALLLAVFVVVASTMVYRSFGDDGRGGVVQTVSDSSATETDSEENSGDNNSESGIAVIAETEENSGSIPMLTSSANETSGDCYVSGLGIQSLADGEAPFDDDDDVGNDSSDSNLIVRSFDYLDYTLEYATALTDSTVPVDSGNLMVEFVLTCDPSVAEFETDVLNWCNNLVVTYTYEDGTTSTTWDSSKTVVKQVLTGYRALSQNDGVNAIPGSGTLNVSVYVKAAANGTIFQPSFSVWMDGNTDAQKITVESEEIVVSATPRYNVYLARNTSYGNMLAYWDLENNTYSTTTATDTSIYGAEFGYGIGVYLYNTSSSKGLKGIELPSGDITFDIVLTETANGENVTYDNDYAPVLWDWRENQPSSTSTKGYLGRAMTYRGTSGYAYAAWWLPYNKYLNRGRTYCYDGGTWSIEQDSGDPAVYHVTIKDYQFDLEQLHFPDRNVGSYSSTSAYSFGANIGYFSVGYVEFIAQFPTTVESTTNILFSVEATNFEATSISGVTTNSEMITTDNKANVTVTKFPSGSISKTNFFFSSSFGDLYSYYALGDASSYVGSDINLASEIYLSRNSNITLVSANLLQKIDDTALEVPESTDTYSRLTIGSGSTIGTIKLLFAAKPDGTGWADADEMNNTREEELIYFTSMEDLNDAGYTCVGYLYEFRECELCTSDRVISIYTTLHVKDDAEIGYVTWTKNDVRAWTNDTDVMSWTDLVYDSAIGAYGLGDTAYVSGTYTDGYTAPTHTVYTNYTKVTYEDGVIVSGHTNSYTGGNSLLIIGCKSAVSVKVADTVTSSSGTTTKSVYDMDAGERTVTYTITPSLTADTTTLSSTTTNVTVAAILPKGLTYITDSSSVSPYAVIENSDGTSTVTWVLENQAVGETIEPIMLSCTIGAAGTADDVQNNDTLTITATVQADKDGRAVTELNGNLATTTITVVRLAASSVSKTVEKSLVEYGEEITYTLNFGNNAEADLQDTALYDIMPYDGDTNGSDFSGAYTITKIVIDYTSAQNSWADSQSTIAASYTKDSAGRDSSNAGSILDGTSAIAFSALSGTATQGTYTLTWDNLSMADITGLLFYLGTVKGNEYISITVTISPTADSAGNVQQPGDIYANSFYQYASNQVAVVTSNSVQAQVVNRVLSGLAWLDSSRDGVRGDSELLLSGLTAQIYRTTTSSYDSSATVARTVDGVALYTAFDVLGNAQTSITTSDDGAYSWNYLEAGTYYVVISDIPDTYGLTEKDSGENDSVDSDAYGYENADGTLQYVWIAEISLSDAEDMYSYYYESAHNDAGFLPTYGSITIIKLGSSNEALEGVSFTVTDTSEKVVATGETDSEGKVVFEELDLGTYEITETSSDENLTLLSSAITVTIPLTMTEAEVAALGSGVNAENGTLQNGVWYFYDLTYTITNSAGFTMPNAGMFDNMPMPVFCGILGVCLVTECYWFCGWKRRKIEEISMIR